MNRLDAMGIAFTLSDKSITYYRGEEDNKNTLWRSSLLHFIKNDYQETEQSFLAIVAVFNKYYWSKYNN